MNIPRYWDLRVAVRRPDYSHTISRSWDGIDVLDVYRVEPESPSGCEKSSPETRAILADEGKRIETKEGA